MILGLCKTKNSKFLEKTRSPSSSSYGLRLSSSHDGRVRVFDTGANRKIAFMIAVTTFLRASVFSACCFCFTSNIVTNFDNEQAE